jgi:hypothetical protein
VNNSKKCDPRFWERWMQSGAVSNAGNSKGCIRLELKSSAHAIGTGVLSWNKYERVFDRYGTLKLFTDVNEEDTVDLCRELAGKNGHLMARVKITRDSYHIGDLSHGVFPVTPNVNDVILLGTGTLFFEIDEDGGENVGVIPLNSNSNQWMNIYSLYRVHYQTVTLFFEQK